VLWQGLVTNDSAIRGWSALLLALAFGTDWVDGYVARRYGITSQFGAMLDTSVDKVAVVIPMIMLGLTNNIASTPLVGWALFILTTQREVAMFIGRPILDRKWGIQLHVQPIGKFKMALQCAAIVAAFWPATAGELSQGLFWAATGCAVASQYDYYYSAKRMLAAARRSPTHAT